MERLTRVIKGFGNDVIVYTQGKYDDTTAGEMENKDVRNVMKHLFEYENTGFTPPEIMELKERDTAKAPEHAPTGYGMICPVCGNLVQLWQKHCGGCGQKLRED